MNLTVLYRKWQIVPGMDLSAEAKRVFDAVSLSVGEITFCNSFHLILFLLGVCCGKNLHTWLSSTLCVLWATGVISKH
jgi:hypothetical protein